MAAKSVLESDVWKKQGIVVIDGGLGTEVDDRGYSINDNPLWSASVVQSNPEVIRDIHLDFLRAGAEVIITATFSASIEKFCEHLNMTEDEAKELIKLPVRLAREARDIFIKENPERPRPLIAGSVGPYGSGKWEFVKDGKAATYTGIYVDSISKETIKEFHRPRIECLLSENVDLLAIEAIPAQVFDESVLYLPGQHVFVSSLLFLPSVLALCALSCICTFVACRNLRLGVRRYNFIIFIFSSWKLRLLLIF
jgi:homocysteine S-methyltransferase